MSNKNTNKNSGYAVLELLFYIALFAVLSLASINSMVTMTKSLRETSIQSQLLESGNIVERITREIRQAYGVSSITASTLVLNTTDDVGANKTVQFSLSGGNVELRENGSLTGNLNTPNINVSALSFTQITTAKGLSIKFSITVVSRSDVLNRSKTFYNTVVLRGDY